MGCNISKAHNTLEDSAKIYNLKTAMQINELQQCVPISI